MTERLSFIHGTVTELSRRKVPRTVGAYAVGVFAALQLMDAAVEPLRLPDWLPTLVVMVLILGFPLVFLLAWKFDISRNGIRKAIPTGLLTRMQSTMLFSFSLLAMFGLGYIFYEYYSGVFDSTEPSSQQGRQFAAPANSIAVLPFTDLSAAGDQAYFSDGVAEEILNVLAQVDGLHVAARTSSFAFRDQNEDIREIGRLLNVQTVLEGSIRSDGKRVRLTAQLINVQDGYHIWSQSYDRELDDLFAIQEEIASSIAQSLVKSFAGLNQKTSGQTDILAAANAYRTGRLHWWRRTPAELQTALGFFAEALEHDAAFAPAYAAMADSWMLLSLYGNITPVKATQKAQPMIDKGLELDPESAETFAALGLARWRIGQYDAAESALRRAVELNEDYIPAQLWLAGVLGDQGRYPEENSILEQAMELDPLNELLAVNYAENQRIRGNLQESRRRLKNLVNLRPDSTVLLRALAEQELEQGHLLEGYKLAQRSYSLEPDDPADVALLAETWLKLGQTGKAEELLTAALEKSGQNFNLLNVYWLNLLLSDRLEEGERLAHELVEGAGDEPTQPMMDTFNMQLGLLALARQDYAAARKFLENAYNPEEEGAFNVDEILAITLASLASAKLGDAATAASRLAEAERKITRARLNGVDDSEIHYSEAVVLAMRDNMPEALNKLQQAYDHGFRDLWLLKLDWRLDGLRHEAQFVELKSRIGKDIEQAMADIRALNLAAL
jgi:TolB-like protein/Flp pilus assembly protein TadD